MTTHRTRPHPATILTALALIGLLAVSASAITRHDHDRRVAQALDATRAWHSDLLRTLYADASGQADAPLPCPAQISRTYHGPWGSAHATAHVSYGRVDERDPNALPTPTCAPSDVYILHSRITINAGAQQTHEAYRAFRLDTPPTTPPMRERDHPTPLTIGHHPLDPSQTWSATP